MADKRKDDSHEPATKGWVKGFIRGLAHAQQQRAGRHGAPTAGGPKRQPQRPGEGLVGRK
jgi:hypothetical protein